MEYILIHLLSTPYTYNSITNLHSYIITNNSEVYDINKCKIDFITCKGKDEITKSKVKIEKMIKYDNPYVIICYDIDSKNFYDNIKNEKIKKFIFENNYNEIYFEKKYRRSIKL